MSFKKAYDMYKNRTDDMYVDKMIQNVVRTFKEDCDQIRSQLEMQTEMHNFMSSVIPMSKQVRLSAGFKLDGVLPKEMESEIPSLRPISELQSQALKCRDFMDVGSYHAFGDLIDPLEDILQDVNFDEFHDDMTDSLTQTNIVERDYDNVGYVHDFLDKLDDDKYEIFADEMDRAHDESFVFYGKQVLDLYGGLPVTCYDVMYNKLNAVYADMGNNISGRDMFLTPEFDTNYLVHKEWAKGQNGIFEQYAELYSSELNQSARDQLGQLMTDLGHGADWSKYAKDHNVPVLTEENEFKAIVEKNERIANGMDVPDWVKEREEQGGYDYAEF